MIMKATTNMKKAALMMLLLTTGATFTALAQTFTPPIGAPADLDVGAKPAADNTVPEGATVLFYNPATGGPTFIISPSLKDDNDIEFETFRWSRVRTDGSTYGEIDIPATTNHGRYVIGPGGNEEALAPGYHVFRLLGFVGEGTSECLSAEWQDYVVYVLPPLSVSAGLATGSSTIREYCEAEVPQDADAVILSNELAFKTASVGGETGTYKPVNDDFPSPETADFTYNYQWYSILLNSDGTPGTRTAITGATNANYQVNLAPGQDGYNGHGTYIFEVEVQYAAKDAGTRDYVRYVGRAQGTAGEDLEITITPQPGRPTITIESPVD